MHFHWIKMATVKVVCLLVLAAHVALCCRKYDLSQIRVQGNQLVNVYNEPVVLRGLNYGSSESECVKDTTPRKVFDGRPIKSILLHFNRWEANAIRIHLNEYCWQDTEGRTSRRRNRGMRYREHIEQLTRNLTNAGYVVILNLYWSEPGDALASGQTPMPNTDNSINFWRSVAELFKNDQKVFFELFSEPYPDNEQPETEEDWECLRDGGTACDGLPFQAVGMQRLVNTIRQDAVANNVILIGGLAKSNSLTRWLDYKPNDPLNNIAAAWHSTSSSNCNTRSCWDSTVGAVKQQYPVVTTAFGGPDETYATELMDWMDEKLISYFALTYNEPEYAGDFALINTYTGGGTDTTPYGGVIKNHLRDVTRNINMP